MKPCFVVLEDSPERVEWLKEAFPDVRVVWAEEVNPFLQAVEKEEKSGALKAIIMDHDLGFYSRANDHDDEGYDGSDAANFLELKNWDTPILIWSMNPSGANRMAAILKEKGYGKIINISSSAAIAPPAPAIHYTAAKAGVLGLTLDLALELAPFNICVNAILPGVIPTEMWDELQIFPPGVDKKVFLQR